MAHVRDGFISQTFFFLQQSETDMEADVSTSLSIHRGDERRQDGSCSPHHCPLLFDSFLFFVFPSRPFFFSFLSCFLFSYLTVLHLVSFLCFFFFLSAFTDHVISDRRAQMKATDRSQHEHPFYERPLCLTNLPAWIIQPVMLRI